MYVRLNMFTSGPGTRPAVERLIDQFAPLFRSAHGFRSVTFFGDDAVGEYASFSLWDTKADAEAADAALLPQLRQAAAAAGLQFQGTPSLRVFEVLEPTA
jgi:heme-degrading monooxygenase HmoA